LATVAIRIDGLLRLGLGMELRIARQIARLSRQELARRAGIDLPALVAIEANREAVYDMPYRSVIHLAQALGVPPGDLFPVSAIVPALPRLVDHDEENGDEDDHV
jgi:transcriptional regulator with XRE-family HTH domain